MKRLFLAVLAMFALSSATFAAQSYPMQCRGGGTIGLVASTKAAVMYFGKAPNKAADGLGVGQCAWLDRAIGTGEPPCLQQNNVNAVAWITYNNTPSYQALTSTHFQPNEARVQWMRNLLTPTNYQTFYAYNPGTGGCFVVTAP